MIEDLVNHPNHYNTRSMEAIDIIETCIEDQKNPVLAYLMSNTVKYLLRYEHKGTPIQDLKKARWYLDRMIHKLEEAVNEENRSAPHPSITSNTD